MQIHEPWNIPLVSFLVGIRDQTTDAPREQADGPIVWPTIIERDIEEEFRDTEFTC